MDVLDASIDRWVREFFWPALMGSLAAFAYLSILARANVRARLLVTLLQECRRRILLQERLRAQMGFAPRLDRYRRLEQELLARIAKEGLKA